MRRSFYIKILQTFASVVCNITFLAQKQALDGASGSQALAVKGLFYLNIAVSVVSALLAEMNFFMRSSILKTVSTAQYFSKTAAPGVRSDLKVN